jgi:hypothetical protein
MEMYRRFALFTAFFIIGFGLIFLSISHYLFHYSISVSYYGLLLIYLFVAIVVARKIFRCPHCGDFAMNMKYKTKIFDIGSVCRNCGKEY